jgi:protein involved in polysaccharide export with SLBB domain
MRTNQLLVLLTAALALSACAQRGPQFAPYRYTQMPQAVPAPMTAARGPVVYTAPPSAPVYAQPAPPVYQAPVAAPAPVAQSYSIAPSPRVTKAPPSRGFFAVGVPSAGGPYMRAPAPVYRPPVVAPPPVAAPRNCAPGGCPTSQSVAAYPVVTPQQPYTLDAGDRLRITVFGQDGLTNSYTVDASGNVTIPLVGTIPARGLTTEQLAYTLTERLKQGYIREPKVAIEVEAYRPFFIHGEVANPGQYAYVANMTVENAIAIAGGFSPRADRSKVAVTRTAGGLTNRAAVGLAYPLRPGDTIRVGERWF